MGDLSREYLEETLAAAKRLLPGWQYAVLRNAALPRSGGRAAHRLPPKQRTSTVQSLIFDKGRFSEAEAKRWAEENGYDFGKVDETEDSLRLRQEEPEGFETFRTIELAPGVKAVLGIKGAQKQEEPCGPNYERNEDGLCVQKARAFDLVVKGLSPAMALARAKVEKDDDRGVMVALFMPPAVADALAIQGGEAPSNHHITLAYLGKRHELPLGFEQSLAQAVRRAVRDQPTLRGKLSGVGKFNGQDGRDVVYASPDVPGLEALRERVLLELAEEGIPFRKEHGFDPHVTLAYVPSGVAFQLPTIAPLALDFDEIVIADGSIHTRFPFRMRRCPFDMPEGGIHLHGLERESNATQIGDGEHRHLFILPDGTEIVTEEDGAHAHEGLDGERIADGGAHVHRVALPDGTVLTTSTDDLHGHDLQVWTTAFDGEHVHWLVLPDGTKIKSPTPSEYWKHLGSPAQQGSLPPSPDAALPTMGPREALMFVGAAPTPLDVARKEALTGPAGAAFRDEILERLGIAKTQVAIGHVVPTAIDHGEPTPLQVEQWSSWIRDEIARMRPRAVIALGQIAKQALGELADFALPHPAALQKGDRRGEVARKLKAIQKRLTETPRVATDSGKSIKAPIQGADDRSSSGADVKGTDQASARRVAIAKADRAKQVVYGVVLDPYTVDTQNDWAPPATIESTGHQWLAGSRVVGLEHSGKAAAKPVESFMVPYPTSEDYAKAMRNEPHKALRMPLGNQQVGSGAWILGVKIDDAATWAKVESGDLDAFSIGGFSERIPVTRAAMPMVEFV